MADPAASDPPSEEPTERRFRIGMVAKATMAMLFVGLIPLIAFGAISLARQRDQIQREAAQVMKLDAERIASQIDEWVGMNIRALNTAANLPAIIGMQREDQPRILAAIKAAYPWMYLVFTIAPNGMNVARSDEQPLVDYKERGYYKDIILLGKEVAWEAVLGKTSGKPSLLLAVPIKSGGATVGVMAAGSTVEEISKVVAGWHSGKTGYAFLVDENGKVLAHPQQDYVLSQRKLLEHPLVAGYRADNQPHLLTFSDVGTESLGYVQGNRFHWAIATQVSTQELFAPQHQTLVLGLLLLAGAGVLVTLIAVFASKLLVHPIVEMTHAADQMSMGELSKPIRATGNDELSMLAKALERLRKSMLAAMQRLSQSR
jgi:methyl-accepting chemotaxis protein